VRILLVIPRRDAGFTKFPDEVLSIAGMLEKHGHEVQVHDANLDNRQPGDFLSFDPNIVGFAVATGPNIADAKAKSVEFKRLIPGIKTVWGFRHPSALPKETLVESYVDYVIIGAGEYTLLELVQYLENGDIKLAGIKGLAYKQNGQVVINKPRPFINNLDELPDPAWHLVDIKKYWDVAVNVSRGCSLSCTFCSDPTFHKGYTRNLSAECIVTQMEKLHKNHEMNLIYLSGDNFFLDSRRLKELCNLLIEKKLKVKWNCDINGPISQEDAALMARAGCSSVIMGVESGSQRMLDFLRKGNVEEIEKTFWILVKYKIIPTLFFMYGYPTETVKDFKMSLDLIKRLDNPPYLFMKFLPYPQTALYGYCLEEGFISFPPQCLGDWADFPTFYTNEVNLSEVPQGLIDQAVASYRKTYSVVRFRFMLKYKPSYFWMALRKPVEFFKALRNLVRHQLTRKEDDSVGGKVNKDGVSDGTKIAPWVKTELYQKNIRDDHIPEIKSSRIAAGLCDRT
jgi:radical SAM superfamily enzyme YgiQ (UPF0313 family)